MSDDVRTVNIQGEAAKDLAGGGKRTRRTAKKTGGAEEIRDVAPVIQQVQGTPSASTLAAQSAPPTPSAWLKYPPSAPVPPSITVTPSHIPSSPLQAAAPTNQYAVSQQGGTKQVKVELKKKSATKKVQLKPKKADAPKTPLVKKTHTRKIRKVTLGVSSLHKRMTRAKKLHKSIKQMPIEALKDKLVKGGLIKATSKAPEGVLRQIARDVEVVAKKAL